MKRVEQALHKLLSTPVYKERMREIQAQILQEDGVTTFCTAVEQVLRHAQV